MRNRVFIIGGLRTHFGMKNGVFRHVRPEVLGGRVMAALADRYDAGHPDMVICGNASGPGGNIGRLALLEGGLDDAIPAVTLDLQCASGLAAIDFGASKIRAGDCRLVMAGGLESASLQIRKIYPENDERSHFRNPEFHEAQFRPGEYGDDAMLLGAERAAKAAGITKEEADEAAMRSRRLAKETEKTGRLNSVILPFAGSTGDEGIRVLPEKIYARAPHVTNVEGGILTAANCCTFNDGAAFLVLASEDWVREHGAKPEAEIVDTHMAGGDPSIPPLSADLAVSQLLKKQGIGYSDVDAFEYNEAFSVITAHFKKAHPDVADRLNQWGGAVAFGHPYGASGAEIMLHLMKILEYRHGNLGIAAIPAAGGVGEAILIRRLHSMGGGNDE
jgi:acetyl-CoA C-acetyltransferase